MPLGSGCGISEVNFNWNKRCDVIERNETTDRIHASALGHALRRLSTGPRGPVTVPNKIKHNSWFQLTGYPTELLRIP